MTRTTMIFGAAMAVLMAGAAHAQAPDRPGRGPGPGGPRGGDLTLLRAADADGNGVATRAEVEALLAEEFAWRDRNGDGVLDRADLGPLAARVAQLRSQDPWAPARGMRAGGGDNRVTRDAFAARAEQMFARLDTDGDGGISAVEAQAARRDRMDRMERRDGQAPGR